MHPSRLLFPSAGDNATARESPGERGSERLLAAGPAIHDPCMFPATPLRRSIPANETVDSQHSGVLTVHI